MSTGGRVTNESEEKEDDFKVPAGVARWPDGEAILVLRPQNAPLVLALGHVALKHNSPEALREACTSGPMIYMGFLKRTKKGEPVIVDHNGENPQPLKPGDTFASRHELSEYPQES